MSDSNGQIGSSTLWSQTFTNQVAGWGSVTNLSNINGPLLSTGTTYWLVASTTGSNYLSWMDDVSGIKGNKGFNASYNGGWAYYNNADEYAMEVRVSPTSTPIPAAAWLLGSGLLGLVAIRRRKA